MVSKARLVITAVVVVGRRPGEVARAYGVSRSWVYELLARHRAEGDVAFEPRFHATTGELLRHLTLDTTRNYQPTGRPPGPPPRKPQQPDPS
jgi:hypothetical protein